MIFYTLLCGLCIILLATNFILINEETFILVSFSLFFYFAVNNVSPQVTDSIDNQISKIESSIKLNFLTTKAEYLTLKKLSSSLIFKTQVKNLEQVITTNVKELFKYKSYNTLSNLKSSQVSSLQILQNLERNLRKLTYIDIYFKTVKMVHSKKYWSIVLKEKQSLTRLQVENHELLSKI